jgi:hypothetical protein
MAHVDRAFFNCGQMYACDCGSSRNLEFVFAMNEWIALGFVLLAASSGAAGATQCVSPHPTDGYEPALHECLRRQAEQEVRVGVLIVQPCRADKASERPWHGDGRQGMWEFEYLQPWGTRVGSAAFWYCYGPNDPAMHSAHVPAASEPPTALKQNAAHTVTGKPVCTSKCAKTPDGRKVTL